MGIQSKTGSTECYKARLIAQGFSQRYGADYDETYCPVIRLESLHVLLVLSVQKLHPVDVTKPFLNGELAAEVYIMQPKGLLKERKILCVNLRRAYMG